MEHLALTYSGTVKSMQKVLEAGRRRPRAETEARLAIWWITRLGLFPKVANPETGLPKGDCGPRTPC